VREGYRHEAALLRRVADLGLCRACAAGGAWGEWKDERREDVNMDKIIDRIRKLLELAKHNDNVAEAASAASAAQRLMSEHQIEQAMLEGAAEEPIEHDVLHDDGGRQMAWWRWVLASALCRANGCKGYSRGGGCLGIIGRPADAQTVRYLYAYLSGEIERLCDEAARERGAPGRTWRNSFRLGAATEIANRLTAMRAQVRAEHVSHLVATRSQSTALARIDAHALAVQTYAKEKLKLRTGSASGNSRLDGGAYGAGKRAGAGIDLGRGRSAGLPAPSKRIGGG